VAAGSHKDLSWSYYVFDGGTNFGFMAAPINGTPMQTSYDYDAPVDELGRITPKYKALRELIAKERSALTLPPIPADPKVIEIPAFSLFADSPLLAAAGQSRSNRTRADHGATRPELRLRGLSQDNSTPA
jgi:hypothetical protein